VVVKKLVLGEAVLKPSDTLGEVGLVTGSIVQATVRSTPALYLGSPCSSAELSKRRGPWYVHTWGDCGGGGVAELVSGKMQHHLLDKAPADARAVATALQAAAPKLAEKRVCLADHGLEGGEVIVIANAGEDPRKTCLQALRVRAQVEDISDDLWESGECSLVSEEESRQKTWMKYRHDEVYQNTLWGTSTLLDLDFNEGFKATCKHSSDDPDTVPEVEVIAAIKVLAEKTQRHFKFDFGDGGEIHGDPVIAVAPVVYGGYTPDGNIVGILTSRAKRSCYAKRGADAPEASAEEEFEEGESEEVEE